MTKQVDSHDPDRAANDNTAAPTSARGRVESYDPDSVRPTEAQYAAYLAAYDHFNKALFHGRLPAVLLTLAKHPRALGYFAARKWGQAGSDDGEGEIGEIGLNPELLRSRTPTQSASTLVHEMVHVWQDRFGSPSRRGYHNKEWADEMERVGLMPSDTGSPDGKRTGQRMTHYVVDDGPFSRAFGSLGTEWLLPFVAGDGRSLGKGTAKRRDPSKCKFECPCGQAMWGRQGLLAICARCGHAFVAAEGV